MSVISSIKTKVFGSFSSVSAFLATLGSSFQLCHSICIAAIAILAGIGIMITGFPLFFLFQYNVLLWGIAVLFLIPSIIMFLKAPKCSKTLLVFNIGVVIAGIPANLINLQPFSWIAGGVIATCAFGMYLSKKLKKTSKEVLVNE